MGHKHAGSASQFSLRVCAPYLGVIFLSDRKDLSLLGNENKKVTVAFTFLIPLSATKGAFRVIQERTNPSECTMTESLNGNVLLRVTREIENSAESIESNKYELIEDLQGYRAEFLHWKYHLISVNGKTQNKSISLPSKFLTWLTPPPDARNYIKYRMPFYSIVFLLAVGFIIVWVV